MEADGKAEANKPEGIVIAKVFKLQENMGLPLHDCMHKLFHEFIIMRARDTCLLESRISWISNQSFVVCANVHTDGQACIWVHACSAFATEYFKRICTYTYICVITYSEYPGGSRACCREFAFGLYVDTQEMHAG